MSLRPSWERRGGTATAGHVYTGPVVHVDRSHLLPPVNSAMWRLRDATTTGADPMDEEEVQEEEVQEEEVQEEEVQEESEWYPAKSAAGYQAYLLASAIGRVQSQEPLDLGDVEKYRDNDEYMLRATWADYDNFDKAAASLKNNHDFVLAAVQINASVIRFVTSPTLMNDREILLTALRHNPNTLDYTLRYMESGLLNNIEFWTSVVRLHGDLLNLAPPVQLGTGWPIYNPNALANQSVNVRGDPGVAIAAVENGGSLSMVTEPARVDKRVVLAAVTASGQNLMDANVITRWNQPSVIFTNDKEIVSAAVRSWGMALQFADPMFLDDPEIVNLAVDQYALALQFATDDIRNNRNVVLNAVQRDGDALEYASENLQDDREIALAAVTQYFNADVGDTCQALRFVSPRFRESKEFTLTAVENCGKALIWAPGNLQLDREVLLAAVNDHPAAMLGDQHMDAALRREFRHSPKAYILDVIRANGLALRWTSSIALAHLGVAEGDGDPMNDANWFSGPWTIFHEKRVDERRGGLQGEFEFVINAVMQNPLAMQYATYEMWNDSIVRITAAMKSTQWASIVVTDLILTWVEGVESMRESIAYFVSYDLGLTLFGLKENQPVDYTEGGMKRLFSEAASNLLGWSSTGSTEDENRTYEELVKRAGVLIVTFENPEAQGEYSNVHKIDRETMDKEFDSGGAAAYEANQLADALEKRRREEEALKKRPRGEEELVQPAAQAPRTGASLLGEELFAALQRENHVHWVHSRPKFGRGGYPL